jgi:hypothetical protein
LGVRDWGLVEKLKFSIDQPLPISYYQLAITD